MKSCLFAGPGELPHAGSRAVVFGRWPDCPTDGLLRSGNLCAPHSSQRLSFIRRARTHARPQRGESAVSGRIRVVVGAGNERFNAEPAPPPQSHASACCAPR